MIQFKTAYPLVQRVEHYFSKEGISANERSFEADGVLWTVEMSEKEAEAFIAFASLYERDGMSLL